MRFAHPEFLWSLAVVLPALTLFLAWAWRTKQRLIRLFMSERLLTSLTIALSHRRRKFRLALLVIAVALLFLALARPQWGFEWEEAKQRGLDIVVALDVSKSVLAEDVKPNRLERAKLAALDLARLAQSDRLGLVPFAGSAFLQCPLTFDTETFVQNVRILDVKVIPRDGTALPDAIETALSVFTAESQNEKALVIISDGENHEGDAVAAAQKAAKAGMRIFTIGVGTSEGELIPIRDDKGKIEYHHDADGNIVKTRLARSLLEQVAKEGNGFFLPLTGTSTMEVLYRQGLEPMPKSDIASRPFRHYHERYGWPLGLAILVLITEIFLPERRWDAALAKSISAPEQAGALPSALGGASGRESTR